MSAIDELNDELFGNPSTEEVRLITEIAKRAVTQAAQHNVKMDKLDIEMDITATHNKCPLRLEELLNADEYNFAHDVFGIRQNLDRTTGRLTNFFLPRFARPLPPVEKMTDEQLKSIEADEDHPQCEDAGDELQERREAREDNRVAQATGRAQGEQPS